MTINFYISMIMIALTGFLSASDELDLNWNKDSTKIRHFRHFGEILENPKLSHLGVKGRYLSGSGQFSEHNISQLAETVKRVAGVVDHVFILDTRMESHGFINSKPVDWKDKNDREPNLGKNADEIQQDETEKLLKIWNATKVSGRKVESVATEQEIAALNGFEYVRMPTLDHSHPSDQVVDKFLDLIKNHPNSWFHIHCHVGKGRTTTFMTLFDMFYHAKDLTFDQILTRQKEIDGEDFKKYRKKEGMDSDKWELYDERFNFLKRFYKYCKESDPQTISWQEWLNTTIEFSELGAIRG